MAKSVLINVLLLTFAASSANEKIDNVSDLAWLMFDVERISAVRVDDERHAHGVKCLRRAVSVIEKEYRLATENRASVDERVTKSEAKIAVLIETGGNSLRDEAAFEIGRLPSPVGVDELWKAAENPSLWWRSSALGSLGKKVALGFADKTRFVQLCRKIIGTDLNSSQQRTTDKLLKVSSYWALANLGDPTLLEEVLGAARVSLSEDLSPKRLIKFFADAMKQQGKTLSPENYGSAENILDIYLVKPPFGNLHDHLGKRNWKEEILEAKQLLRGLLDSATATELGPLPKQASRMPATTGVISRE